MAFPLLLLLGVASACVQDLLYSSTENSVSDAPFAELLQGAICPSIRVNFQTGTEWPVAVSTLGHFASIEVNCGGGKLQVTQTLTVEEGTEASLKECGFESQISATAFLVDGQAVLSDCWMNNLSGVGFEVTGQLRVDASRFQGNTKSIFSAAVYGFSLSVTNSRFTGNTSPQGTIFYWNPSGTLSNSTTSVVFDNCEFRGNTANVLGAGMFISLPLAAFFSPAQLEDSRTVYVANSAFVDSPGVLLYLKTRYVNSIFHNNTFENVENPVHLSLDDNSFSLTNSTMRLSGRPFLCTFVGGLVVIDGLDLLGVSNGPAILLANKAPLGLGEVMIRNVDMSSVNQVEMSWFVSTLYSLSTVVTVENLFIHSGFCFADGCGAYFFSVSSVTNCTITNTTVVQGGLIGSVFGAGRARNIRLIDCPALYGGCTLSLGAHLDYRNVTFHISDPSMMPTYTGCYAFLDGSAILTDVTTTMYNTPTRALFIVMNGDFYAARMRWNQIIGNSFAEIMTASVKIEDIQADYVNVSNFAIINSKSTLELKDITLVKSDIYGAVVSANGYCSAFLSNITVVQSRMQSFIAGFLSDISATSVRIRETVGESVVYAYLYR